MVGPWLAEDFRSEWADRPCRRCCWFDFVFGFVFRVLELRRIG